MKDYSLNELLQEITVCAGQVEILAVSINSIIRSPAIVLADATSQELSEIAAKLETSASIITPFTS